MCGKNIEGMMITSATSARHKVAMITLNDSFLFVTACKKEEDKKRNKNFRKS